MHIDILRVSMPFSEHKFVRYVVVGLVVALIVLVGFLLYQYSGLRRASLINARELRLSNFLHNHGPITPSEEAFIRSWMTFDYINTLFNLPPDYLKAQLSISDTRYPKISVGSYVNGNHLVLATFMGELDAAITNYLTKPGS